MKLALFLFVFTKVVLGNPKKFILYDFSVEHVTDNNCIKIMEEAKKHYLYCLNASELQIKNNHKTKTEMEMMIFNIYTNNKEEIDNFFESFLRYLEIFKKIAYPYFMDSFNPWLKELKIFIKNERELFDIPVLYIINGFLDLFQNAFVEYPDEMDNYEFGKIELLSNYSNPYICYEKYNKLQDLVCLILNKEYYINNYNNFMKEFLEF